MKLFYKPGACSLASHIVLREVGATFESVEVDTDAGRTMQGEDYSKVNPKGYVPALQIDSGDVLTEGAAVLQYIADQYPQSGLAPASGTMARVRMQEYLNYVSSELHKAFGPFFSDSANEEDKKRAGGNVADKLDYVESLLSDGRAYLLGEDFSVADAYLFVISNWSNFVGIDLNNWPNVAAFVDRVANRPASQAAMKAEGLIS